MTTKVFITDFKSNRMFTIKEVDENGEPLTEFDRKTGDKVEKKPVVNLGVRKLKAIALHSNEVTKFLEENSNDANTDK